MAEEFKPTKILRRKQVEAWTGLSRSTIYAWVRDGRFPPPISLGPKAVGWLQSDLDAWMAERTRASRPHPATLRA